MKKNLTADIWQLALITTLLTIVISCQKTGKEDLTVDVAQQQKAASASAVALHTSGEVATDWYNLQFRILLERNSAFNGTHFAYIGIGLYETVRHGISKSVSLSTKLNQMPTMPQPENNGYHWDVSTNAVMARMVRLFYSGLTPANMASIDSLENVYNEKLNPAGNSSSFSRSQSFGRQVATAIHNWFLTDNMNGSNIGYVPPVFPGAWVPTPPAFVNGVNPYVSAARTFMVEHTNMISPPFTIPYSENPSSDFYKMVKQVYDVSQSLTDEQKAIALFWVDQGNGVGLTPPGHDFSVITQALEQTGASLALAAETYAKAGIAERDAVIVTFRSKYANNLIRPVSYIRAVINNSWLPFIVTPPHPEYPAAHSMVTGSALQAAARVVGEHVMVTDRSYEFRGLPARTYHGLFAAAQEAGISRLYGGIHYQNSINVGLAMALQIGNNVGNIKLRE
ncbi:MAG TPA: vanadium-dependent haloperoxidase [Chitinophagaceae bacterium]|nr:vanadium-dependent haloperoxidase [Chitinophagaceae bacterium]